jgi:hypothetical protein
MNEFLQRLKQRKLVQWGVAYVAAAFAFLQGVDIVAQQFGWPQGVRRGITMAMVVGFFVMLVLAWYHGERGAQKVSGTELLILALLLSLGGGFLWRFAGASREPATMSAAATASAGSLAQAVAIPEKSIAVLPFENLSSDKENAFFTDGVQDEILTDLAKVADLKVISRTSVMQFRRRGRAQPAQDRRRVGCRTRARRQCATRARESAGECATDRRPYRRASLGADLRSRPGGCLRHPKRDRADDRRTVASQALA